MKTIVLSQGKFALVDDEDFNAISKFGNGKWHYTNSGYAATVFLGTLGEECGGLQ